MANANYNAEIKYASKELTRKQQAQLLQANFPTLDQTVLSDGSEFIIDLDFYAVIKIHNEKTENKDYEVCIVFCKDGTAYGTGSASFIQRLEEAWEYMSDSDEPWQLAVSKKNSKTRTGAQFLTCRVI